MTDRRIWVVWLVGLMGLAGCDSGPDVQPPSESGDRPGRGGLVAQRYSPIADLPMPYGFEMDQKKSRSFSGGGLRWVDHVYGGSADKFAVARFMKAQMPIHGWALASDRFVQGDILLEFEKNNERCQLTISDSGGVLGSSTSIKVQIWPTGRADGAVTNP